MVGKSKGKQKGLPEVDLVVSKTAAENEKALEITWRLRKGHSLESLVKEAQALANDHPSAISLLCLAKVVLAQAVDGLMSNSLTGEARAEIRYAQQQQLNKAMTDACTGASEHASILCGRFYYRLAEIAQPDFDSLKWPHVDNLVDPQTELLEQVLKTARANLDFGSTFGFEGNTCCCRRLICVTLRHGRNGRTRNPKM